MLSEGVETVKRLKLWWWRFFGQLHLYADDYETVIAYSVADALDVASDTTGAEYDRDAVEYWGQVSDGQEVTIWCDPTGEPAEIDGDDSTEVTKTAREWCARGRGYLCCTES
jgi:hypothetical protein